MKLPITQNKMPTDMVVSVPISSLAKLSGHRPAASIVPVVKQ